MQTLRALNPCWTQANKILLCGILELRNCRVLEQDRNEDTGQLLDFCKCRRGKHLPTMTTRFEIFQRLFQGSKIKVGGRDQLSNIDLEGIIVARSAQACNTSKGQ